MPFDGSGNFTPITPYNPVITDTVISSTAFNATVSDIAVALNNMVTRDGQGGFVGNLDLKGNKLLNVGTGTAAAPSISFANATGFYHPATNSIGIAVNGLSVGMILDTGLNGMAIGQVTPAAGKFSTLATTGTVNFAVDAIIGGNASVAGQFFLVGNGGSGYSQQHTISGPNGTVRFRMAPDGSLEFLSGDATRVLMRLGQDGSMLVTGTIYCQNLVTQ